MQATIPANISRILICVVPVIFLAGCFGEGDGPTRIPGTPAPPPPPEGFCDGINFETACEPFEFTNFAGGDAGVVDNPDPSGLNTTDRVARMLKFDPGNGEAFGGTKLPLDGGVDFSEGTAFTMKVWASRSVPVLFKLETVNQFVFAERSGDHSGSSAWEELCFDFTGSTAGLVPTDLTVIFDIGVIGEAATDPNNWTFYFDEITQVANCDDGGGGGVDPAGLPVTFEATPASYDFGQENGFAGGVATVIANPDPSGLNTTAQTARMQKFPAEVFGGATLVLGDPIDFSEGDAFTMKVWSPRPVPFLFKLEDAVSGLPELGKERTASHSGSGSWEQFCFDFSGDVAGFSSNSITFIFDPNVLGDAENNPDDWTFYFDEITQVASCDSGGADAGIIPDAVVYASDPSVTVDLAPPVVGDLGSGSTFDFFFNGDADFNPALRVTSGGDPIGGGGEGGNIVVNGGFETGGFDGWERFVNGGVLSIVTDNPSSGTFAANLLVPVRGAGDSAADPLIKNANLEAGNLTPGATVTVSFDMRGTLSGAGGVVFAELFSELAGEGVSKAEILSGGPLVPTADWSTYSFTTTLGPDVGGGVTVQLKASCGPVEGCGVDAFIDNVSVVVGTDGGAGVAPPIAFGPLDIGLIALTGYAPGFAAGFETFNFKVKGLPEDSIEVRFIEGGDTSRVYNVATYAGSTDLGNGWYQLSIPLTEFAATIASNQGFVLGPLGPQAAPFTFLLTDIGFSGTAGGGGEVGDNIVINGGFESATFDGWETFPGGGIQAIVTDNPSSGTYAANLVVPVRGPTDSGIDNFIKSSNLEAGNLTPGAAVTVSFDMRGTLSGAGGVVFAELFSEQADGGVSKSEILSGGPLVPTADWVTYTFSTTLGPDVSGGVTLQLKASCGPVEGCGVDVFFDNISISTGGGVEPPPPPVANFPTITFDDPAVTYTLTDFGGNASVVTNDPAGGGNMVAQVLRPSTADVSAGTTVSTLADLAVPAIPFSASEARMSVRVYSPDAGVPVVVKVEDRSNDALFVEALATTTVANEWETLTFDFSSPQPSSPPLNLANTYDKLSIFFNPGSTGEGDKTYYVDDIAFGASINFAVNGGFETGTFEGWETLPGGGIQAIVSDNPSSGTFAANLVVPVRTQTDPPVDNLIKNSNLEAGNLTPGAVVTVSFDMRGTLSGAGGVVFAELFSELAGAGTSKSEILSGGPLVPSADWTTYSFTTTLGPDVSGGVTIQLKTSCGPVEGCGVDVFFDNVSIVSGEGDAGGGGDDGGSGGGGVIGGGGVWDGGGIAINGGFETGTFDGWETIPNGGIQAIVMDSPSSGTYAANLIVPVRTQTDAAVDNLIKNSNLEAGNLTPGAAVTVSFDMRGTLVGAGGVVFAEFFSELTGGGTSKAEIFSGGPITPTTDWTKYTFSTTLGPDVSGGVTLQLKTSCGPVEGCGVDVFFDNVSIVIN